VGLRAGAAGLATAIIVIGGEPVRWSNFRQVEDAGVMRDLFTR
jgi:hypothetical protein